MINIEVKNPKVYWNKLPKDVTKDQLEKMGDGRYRLFSEGKNGRQILHIFPANI